MRLIRFGEKGNEKPGVEINGKRYEASNWVDDYDEMFFASDQLEKLKKSFKADETLLVDESARWSTPIAKPEKIICIGLNYLKHAQESGMDVPREPVVFFKAPSSVCGPFDEVIIPKDSQKTDWEVELAVVIGKKASYVSESEAMNHVAGYVLHNDVSERAFQLEMGGQWVKGKSADTFAPLGPYLVTKDEIEDPHNLRLWLKLNGETLQEGKTDDLIFNIPQIISYLSRFMTLTPGDVISTGTPHGVGLGLDPQRFLKPGDEMELGIDGLGVSRQKVIAWK